MRLATGNNVRLVVVGQSGSGKTWWARRLLRLAPGRRVVLTDDGRDYADLGLRWVRVEGRHAAARFAWLREGEWLLEITSVTAQETRILSAAIARALWDAEPALVVVDEAYRFIPRHPVVPEWQRHATGGRHIGHDYVFVTQSVVDLDLTAVRMATALVAFRVVETNEAERISRITSGLVTPGLLRALPTGVAAWVDLTTTSVRLVTSSPS